MAAVEAARLGRYRIRCPLVLDRLEWDEERQEVVYAAHPGKLEDPFGIEARWDVLDFLARVTQHIPDPGQQYQRYWGFYSNAARGRHLEPKRAQPFDTSIWATYLVAVKGSSRITPASGPESIIRRSRRDSLLEALIP